MQKRMAERKPKSKRRNPGGRPRKFSEASKPITVTLPERTLELLASVHGDRALAIARAADWVTQAQEGQSPAVELVEVEKGRSIILVGPSRSLRKIGWLRLVQIAPARYLLVIPTGTAIESLEVAVTDLLDGAARGDTYERKLLSELARCLTLHRRGKKLSKAELLLIDSR